MGHNILKMKDLKYLLAYALPGSALLALVLRGPWSWATVILAFFILPILEFFAPVSTENIVPEEEANRSKHRLFDILLYTNALLLFGIVVRYLLVISQIELGFFEKIGLTLSVGIIVGAIGINVAHELGHRSNKMEQLLAKVMLLPALYQHFFIEHNRGHHKNVATDQDPATARLGEPVYFFWLRSVVGSWHSAWLLEQGAFAKSRWFRFFLAERNDSFLPRAGLLVAGYFSCFG